MGAKGRSRRKYTWLRGIGTQANSEEPENALFLRQLRIAVPLGGQQINAIVPVVFDTPQDDDVTVQTQSLADQIGSEWFVERIVGKLDIMACTESSSVGSDQWCPNSHVAAGFFVARADQSDPDQPIGEVADLNEDYSPLNPFAIREPWMWHRSWVLGTLGTTGAPLAIPNRAPGVDASFPHFTTAQYVGQNNNNLIDTNSVRRIRQDERLFFAIAAQQATWGSISLANREVILFVTLGVRVLGALRRASQTGAF